LNEEAYMADFQPDSRIPLLNGGDVTIVSKIGHGGQGSVYRIKMNNQPYALKWYAPLKLRNSNIFRKNLERNIAAGPPGDSFCWPLYLTRNSSRGSFGYVMRLLPDTYVIFTDIVVLGKAAFGTMDAMFLAAMNIAGALRTLHRKGLSYQDLHDENIAIDPASGKVLLIDNDNVTPGDLPNSGGIGGKPGFMAPEIVRGEKLPNMETDLYSLAVIFFFLFFRGHPLEGKKLIDARCFTEKTEYELYGAHPVFIFDPTDPSNRPVPGIQKNPLRLWHQVPEFFRQAFIRSFGPGLNTPGARIPENQWIKILTRLRDEFIDCPCGLSLFVDGFGREEGQILCPRCHQKFHIPERLFIGDRYQVPLWPGKNLYACHTTQDEDFTTITGRITKTRNLFKKKPGSLTIQNLSTDSWSISTQDGKTLGIPPGGSAELEEETSCHFGTNAGVSVMPVTKSY
jgi:serine/threonine protein kinase